MEVKLSKLISILTIIETVCQTILLITKSSVILF